MFTILLIILDTKVVVVDAKQSSIEVWQAQVGVGTLSGIVPTRSIGLGSSELVH